MRRNKMSNKRSPEKWSEIKERRNKLLFYIAILIYKLLNKQLTQIILQPVLLFFFITDKNGRRESEKYLDKLYKTKSSKLRFRPGLINSFIHYNSFTSSLLDRVGIGMPGKRKNFKVSFFGYDEMETLVRNKKGAFFIGAHFGNFDVIRLLDPAMKLKVLMRSKYARMMNELFSSFNQEIDNDMIEIESINAATSGELAEYVENGGFLGILGDRVHPGSENRAVRFPFLGEDASFPQGPWIIANILKCPVVFFYAVSTATLTYEIHFEKLFDTVNITSRNRENDIRKYLGEYVLRLENACRSFPYQWYNFHNFWPE